MATDYVVLHTSWRAPQVGLRPTPSRTGHQDPLIVCLRQGSRIWLAVRRIVSAPKRSLQSLSRLGNRAVAIERCPFFWTEIVIRDLRNVPHTLRQSGAWIPLEIDCGTNTNYDDLEQFLNFVIPHSERWRSLKMDTTSPAHTLRALKGPFSGLETLHLSLRSHTDFHVPNTIQLAGIKDLKLISVTLPTYAGKKHKFPENVVKTGAERINLGLANLTALQLQGIQDAVLTSTTMVDVLRASPNIQLLDMFTVGCHEVHDANLPAQGDSTVVLPYLRHLSLHEIPESFIHQVLGSLHAEHLRYLHAATHEQFESGRVGWNILHHLIANREQRASMVSSLIRNRRRLEGPKEDPWNNLIISSPGWPLSIQGDGQSTVQIRVINNSWLQEPMHPNDILVFQDLDVIFEVYEGVGLLHLLRDGFPVLDYVPSLVMLGLHDIPEETIGVVKHITGVISDEECPWPCPKLAEIQLGDMEDFDESEMAALQSSVARLVAAFLDSPKRLDRVVPQFTLIEWPDRRQEFSRVKNTFVRVRDDTWDSESSGVSLVSTPGSYGHTKDFSSRYLNFTIS